VMARCDAQATSEMGHELPRHLAERAAVMPPKAAAPSRDQGGRGGPKAEFVDYPNKMTASIREHRMKGLPEPPLIQVRAQASLCRALPNAG
jgi:hypothetical protein